MTRGTLFPEAGEWPGREGLLRFTEQQMEAFERMWIEPLEFRDGQVVRLEPFLDRSEALHAAGLA